MTHLADERSYEKKRQTDRQTTTQLRYGVGTPNNNARAPAGLSIIVTAWGRNFLR